MNKGVNPSRIHSIFLTVRVFNPPHRLHIVDRALIPLGRIVSISDSVMQNLGVSSDKWADVETAIDQLEILLPDGSPRPREQAPLYRAIRGEVIKNEGEMICNLVTGQLRWREASGAPIRDAEGTIIGAMAVARDITDRKQAEAALRESQALYRAIANNFPDGAIYVFDHDLRFRIADAQALGVLGFTREGLEGKTIWEATDEETCRILEQRYPRVLAGETLQFETALKGAHLSIQLFTHTQIIRKTSSQGWSRQNCQPFASSA